MASAEWTTFKSDSGDEWEGGKENKDEDEDWVEVPNDDTVPNGESETSKILKVAELTGLKVPDAQELLQTAEGDIQTAVMLHFETSRMRPGLMRPATAPVSRPVNPQTPSAQRRGSDSASAQPLPPVPAPVRQSRPTTPEVAEVQDDPSMWLSRIRKQAQEASDILRRCEATGDMFVDTLFPAEACSLGGCTGAPEVRRWCRPVETWDDGEPSFFQGAVQADDVVQGRAKDCWFLGALAIVASKPGMLQQLVQFSWVAKGMHAVRFFVEGEWITVVVDDLVPCCENGSPIFGRCKDPHHVWVQVFEKAFAKLCGSYRAIESGSEDDALVALTGGSPDIVELHEEEEELLNGGMWRRLVGQFEGGALMGCANHGTAATSGHIEPHHAYSILSVLDLEEACGLSLLQVRNPWGTGEWTGRFSPGSPSWNSIPETVREMLGKLASREDSLVKGQQPQREHVSGPKQGGTFFMCFEDFYSHFDRVYLVKLPPSEGYTVTRRGAWSVEGSGGCNNFATCALNPQFRVLMPQAGSLRIRLFQRQPQNEATWRVRAAPPLHIGMYVLEVDGEAATRVALPHISEDAVVGKTASFINAWQVSVKVDLADCSAGTAARRGGAPRSDSGERALVVVPCTYSPGCEGSFVLSVWSDQPAVMVEQIAERMEQLTVSGDWRAGAAGGCRNNVTWLDNPVAKLTLPHGGGDGALLLRLRERGAGPQDVRAGMGLYVVQRGGHRGWRDTSVQSDPFVVGRQVSLKLPPTLQAGEYLVVLCTFRPEEHLGAFHLSLCTPPGISGSISMLQGTARSNLAADALPGFNMNGAVPGFRELFGNAPPLFQLPVYGDRSDRGGAGEGWVEGHRGYRGADERTALELAMALSLSEADK